MGYSTDRYYSATVDIVATSRAKERAAQKLGIPFKYGKKIETYGVSFKKPPMHVHVDLENISSRKKTEYFSLMKKYTKQEINRLCNPLAQNLLLALPVFVAGFAIIFGLTKCEKKKSFSFQPNLIQKADRSLAQQNQRTR